MLDIHVTTSSRITVKRLRCQLFAETKNVLIIISIDRCADVVSGRFIRSFPSDGRRHGKGRREIVAEKRPVRGHDRLATAGVVHVRARRRRVSGRVAHSFRWVQRNNKRFLYFNMMTCNISHSYRKWSTDLILVICVQMQILFIFDIKEIYYYIFIESYYYCNNVGTI